MTSSTLVPSSAAGARAADAVSAAPPAAVPPVTGAFDGLTWLYRPGATVLLESVSAAQWARPEAQGWQQVKRNSRRTVWRAVLNGRPYYLKYFFDRPWRRFLSRLLCRSAVGAEWAGGLFALQAGISAVRPVACTRGLRCGGRTCDLLLSEAVEPAQPLDEFWQLLQSDDNVRRRRADTAQLADQLAEMIARAHQAGFEHLDMHPANVLVERVAPRRYRPLFVDLQCARRGVPIRDGAVVRNLAQLNQWFRKHSTLGERLRFLRAYLRWRNEYEDRFAYGRPLGLDFAELVRALAAAAWRHAERLGTRRDHRVLRDGRYFARLRLAGGWRGMAVARCKHATPESPASQLVFDAAWWHAQLRDPLRWFAPDAESGAAVCKDSHSALVARAVLPHPEQPVPVIIKRPRARNWRRRLSQWLTTSRSARGWQIGHALLHRDIATARPLALLERRVGPFVRDSVLITEAVPDALDLESSLRQEHARGTPRAWARLKRALTPLLVAHLRRTLEHGFTHRDCKASNLLLVRHPRLRLLWIDMDGLRWRGQPRETEMLRPLVRLHVSLLDVPGLSRTDRVRFLRAWCTRFGQPPERWRELWPTLAAAGIRKTRALAARRAWKVKHYGRT